MCLVQNSHHELLIIVQISCVKNSHCQNAVDVEKLHNWRASAQLIRLDAIVILMLLIVFSSHCIFPCT